MQMTSLKPRSLATYSREFHPDRVFHKVNNLNPLFDFKTVYLNPTLT